MHDSRSCANVSQTSSIGSNALLLGFKDESAAQEVFYSCQQCISPSLATQLTTRPLEFDAARKEEGRRPQATRATSDVFKRSLRETRMVAGCEREDLLRLLRVKEERIAHGKALAELVREADARLQSAELIGVVVSGRGCAIFCGLG